MPLLLTVHLEIMVFHVKTCLLWHFVEQLLSISRSVILACKISIFLNLDVWLLVGLVRVGTSLRLGSCHGGGDGDSQGLLPWWW